MSTEVLKYVKIRKVKSPSRAHSIDAGIDFYVPEDINADVFNAKSLITGQYPSYEIDDNSNITKFYLMPGQSALIPSGIKLCVPEGYALVFTNKSGIASKKHLVVGASTVDCGYEGECHLNIHNIGTETVEVSAGDKIVQGILFKIGLHQPLECATEDEVFGSSRSSRGEGGFGSSGVN